jgi:hypothetical protein
MLWVTRYRIRVNRAATGWLVRRFVDPDAAFRFVNPADVARIQKDQGAVGFDASGARYPHQDELGRCSFESLVQEHRPGDRALQELARIVHGADFPEERIPDQPQRGRLRMGTLDTVSQVNQTCHALLRAVPEAAGLRAISHGFPLVAASDEETLQRSAFLYDALYASLQERLGR